MTQPLTTAMVKVGERMIEMRPPSETQLAALLDFDRQATLLDKMPNGEEKNKRSITLARRSLVLVEKLTINSEDWDWMMDSMMDESLDWPEFNEIPGRLFDALSADDNRASRRAAAKSTRTRKV